MITAFIQHNSDATVNKSCPGTRGLVIKNENTMVAVEL